MFNKQQHTDSELWMKSILESGQEDVPAHIWDNISTGLDKIARHRRHVIFWRRAAIGMSAAAAVALGLFFTHPSQDTKIDSVAEIVERVSETDGAISVTADSSKDSDVTAMVAETVFAKSVKSLVPEMISDETGPTEMKQTDRTEDKVAHAQRTEETQKQTTTTSTSETENIIRETEENDWIEDDEVPSRKAKVSLVLSGIAGTNSAQSTSVSGVVRKPTLSAAPVKTSITQTEPGDTYGIPLSFGIGAKVDINSRWALGTGINYTLLTRKFYGDYTAVKNGQIHESLKSDIRNTQHYIGIPINAYYNIVQNKAINFYTYAGGTVEKCVADEYRILVKDILHNEQVKGVQLSVNLGIGVEFMLGNHIGIYIDPSARYYFKGSQPKSIRTAQPFMLGFEMGIRARL